MRAIYVDYVNEKNKYSTTGSGPSVVSKKVETCKEAKKIALKHGSPIVVIEYKSGVSRTYNTTD